MTLFSGELSPPHHLLCGLFQRLPMQMRDAILESCSLMEKVSQPINKEAARLFLLSANQALSQFKSRSSS
jgi:hypothetical protein